MIPGIVISLRTGVIVQANNYSKINGAFCGKVIGYKKDVSFIIKEFHSIGYYSEFWAIDYFIPYVTTIKKIKII